MVKHTYQRSPRIFDKFTYRTDLSPKQKYCLRYPDRIAKSKKMDRERAKRNWKKEREKVKRWRKENPEKTKKQWHRAALKLYGISQEQYAGFLRKQNRRCAICRTKENNGKDWCIDHCHRSKKVRGLLCHKCNLMLGLAKDKPRLLKSAIQYLENRY